jgi:hypothetical protein
MRELYRLRLEAGNPSFRKLASLIDNKGSHTTLASVFNGRHVPRWEIVEALGAALGADLEQLRQLWAAASARAEHGTTAEERRDADVLDRYCQHLLGRPVPSASTSQGPSDSRPSGQPHRQLTDSAGGRLSAAAFESRIERTILLAEAGVGKTFLATHLVRVSAEHRSRAAFLVPMAELVNRATGPPVVAELIDDHLGTALQIQPPKGLTDRLLNTGSHLVVFDGWDEAAAFGRGHLATQIIEAFSDRYPRCRILVTSRPEPKPTLDPQSFASYTLAELEPESAEWFADAWFTETFGPGPGAELVVPFLELIRDIPGVRSNPALLRHACEAFGRQHGQGYPVVTARAGGPEQQTSIGVAAPHPNRRQGEPLQDTATRHDLTASGRRPECTALTPRETRVNAPLPQDSGSDAWSAFVRALNDHRTPPLIEADRTHQRQAERISQALHRRFGGLFDEQGNSDRSVPSAFLHQALAALVVRTLLACDDRAAMARLTRPNADLGFDAIAIAETSPTIWLIQTKWFTGSARPAFTEVDIMKAVHGLRQLEENRLDLLLDTDQARLLRLAFDDPRCTVRVVVAAMSRTVITHGALGQLHSLKEEFNRFGDVLDYEIWDTKRILSILSNARADGQVNITAELDHWLHLTDPFDAYTGVIPAVQVAQWLDQYRDNLFATNIRGTLGRTDINRAIADTLTGRPKEFFYFNNGIIVVCDEAVGRLQPGSRSSQLTLSLSGATIVNGAQTAASIHTAMSTEPEAVAQAMVAIKIVVAGTRNADLTTALARASNRHHPLTPRDLAALDPIQAEIHDDFALGLGKDYVYKRGQAAPAPEAGCAIDDAALALACAHSDPAVAIRAMQHPDTLWRADSDGLYSILFSTVPSGLRIWRSVNILRSVRQHLSAIRRTTAPSHLALPDETSLLVAHLVYHRLDTTGIEDPEADWTVALDHAQENITAIAERLTHWWTGTPHAGEVLADPQACRELVHRLSLSLS